MTAKIGVRKSSFLWIKMGVRSKLMSKREAGPYAAKADTATGIAI